MEKQINSQAISCTGHDNYFVMNNKIFVDVEKCCEKKMQERITETDQNGTIFLTTQIP